MPGSTCTQGDSSGPNNGRTRDSNLLPRLRGQWTYQALTTVKYALVSVQFIALIDLTESFQRLSGTFDPSKGAWTVGLSRLMSDCFSAGCHLGIRLRVTIGELVSIRRATQLVACSSSSC
jgi:hypothetical protein